MGVVLKVDIDFKAPKGWLGLWELTRKDILARLGYPVIRMVKHETKKGQNYFIEIKNDGLTPDQINMLQFLLGDDHTRVKINAWRIERGFERWNKLFDRKLWKKEQKTIECWYCGNIIPLIKAKEVI